MGKELEAEGQQPVSGEAPEQEEIDAELYLEGIPDLGAVVLFIHPDSAISLGVCPERLPVSLARTPEQRADEERNRATQDALLRVQAQEYYNVTVKRRKHVFLALLAVDFLYWLSILVAQMIFKVRGEEVGDADIGAPGGHGGDSHSSPFSPWIQTIHIRVELVVFSVIIDFIGCVAAMQPRTSILSLFLVLIMLGTAVISLQGITLFLLWRLVLIAVGFWFRTSVHIHTLMDIASGGGARSTGGLYFSVMNVLTDQRAFFGILFGMSSAASTATTPVNSSANTAAAGNTAAPATGAAPGSNTATPPPVNGATASNPGQGQPQSGSAVAAARAALNAAGGPRRPVSLGPTIAAPGPSRAVVPSMPGGVQPGSTALHHASINSVAAAGQPPQQTGVAVATDGWGMTTIAVGASPDIEMGRLTGGGPSEPSALALSTATNQLGVSTPQAAISSQNRVTIGPPASPGLQHARQTYQAHGSHPLSTPTAPSLPQLPARLGPRQADSLMQPASMLPVAQTPPMQPAVGLMQPQSMQSASMQSGSTWILPVAAATPQQLPPQLPATFNPLWQPAGSNSTSLGGLPTPSGQVHHVLQGSNSRTQAAPRYSHPGHSSGGNVPSLQPGAPSTTTQTATPASAAHAVSRSHSSGLTPAGLPRLDSHGSGLEHATSRTRRSTATTEAGTGAIGALGAPDGSQQVNPSSNQPASTSSSTTAGVTQQPAGAQAASAATNTLLFQAAMLAALKDMRRVHAEHKGRKAAAAAAAVAGATTAAGAGATRPGAGCTLSSSAATGAAAAATGATGISNNTGRVPLTAAHTEQAGGLLTTPTGPAITASTPSEKQAGCSSSGTPGCNQPSGSIGAAPAASRLTEETTPVAGSPSKGSEQLEGSDRPQQSCKRGVAGGTTGVRASPSKPDAAATVTLAAAEGLQEATAVADLLLQELKIK